MKKIILSLGILFLAISQSAFAAQVGSEYLDIAPTDGQVDVIKVEFDEDVTDCTYEAGDWGINTAGDINITAVTGLSCTGTDHFLEINVTADAGVTGGATAPQITYSDNDGVGDGSGSGSLTMTSGASGNLAINPVDKAAIVVLTPNAGVSPYDLHIDENTVLSEAFTFSADSEAGLPDLLFKIMGGDDGHLFNTTWNSPSAGVLASNSSFDFENPTDRNTDNTYTVVTRSYDSDLNTPQDMILNITVDDVDEAPVFVSGFGAVSVPENQTAATTVVATDPEGAAVTYSIINLPGEPLDSFYFDIDPVTGILTFKNAPDFENPLDRAGIGEPAADNNYLVTVVSSDGVNSIGSSVTVIVTDVNESTGHSGRSHKASSVKKVCKDSKATNFNNVGQHDASLCKYAEEKAEDVKEEMEEKADEQGEQVQGECSVVAEEKGLLRVGSKGQAVKDLQEFLNANGFNTGAVDGIFGKLTKAAVKRMQAKFGVSSDGVVGPQTRGKISCE